MRYFLFLLLMFFSVFTYAKKVHTLYEITLPVVSQLEQDRIQIIPQAFKQVLVKVTGNSAILKDPRVQSTAKQANQYIEAFSYQSVPSKKPFPYLVTIIFDSDEVDHFLQTVGVPVWGENRPLTLIWLSVSSAKFSEIVENDSTAEIYGLFQQAALRYGLPILFPIMDMTDLNQVSVQDIAAMSQPILLHASIRYMPDAILIGQVTQGIGTVQSKWKLIQNDIEQEWSITESTDQNMVNTLFSNLSEALSRRYVASQSNEIVTVELEVTGIQAGRDLRHLVEWIKHLSGINDVEIQQVSQREVSLQFVWRHSLENLLQNLALNPHLALQSKNMENKKLIYEWVP